MNMKYANVRLPDLLVTGYSEDDSRDLSIFSNESQILLPVGDLDIETVKCIATEETYEHELEPEQVFEPILDDDGSVISAGYTIPAVTETRTRTVYSLAVDEDKVAAKAIVTKQALVAEAYNRMDKDVFDACETVYGTRRADSATRQYLTFQAMLATPSDYVPSLFPDVESVVAYATPKMAAATAYSVFCIQRVQQFEAERAAILAQ
jgi:hypothetical protein